MLRERALHAVRWTATGAGLRALIQYAQIALLTRILDPTALGLVSVMWVVIGFAGLFSEAGLGSAVIQRSESTANERTSIFWGNLAIAAIVATCAAALAQPVAWYYGDPALASLVFICAPAIVLAAAARQFEVDSEKALEFRALVLVESATVLVGGVAAVAGALAGLGAASLAWAFLLSIALRSLLAFRLLSRGWRPTLRFRWQEAIPFCRFGGAWMASNAINQFNSNIDLLIGGRLLGLSQLGIYAPPRQLAMSIQYISNPIITRVAFPVMALTQADRARTRRVFLGMTNMTCSVNGPLHLFGVLFASDLCGVVLGRPWAEAGPLLALLCSYGAVRAAISPVGALLLGVGRADRALAWNLALLLVLPAAAWIGCQFGVIGLAYALFVSVVVLAVPAWRFLIHPPSQCGLAEWSAAVARPYVLAILAVVPGYAVSAYFSEPVVRLMVGLSLFAPGYVLLSCAFNPQWAHSVRDLVLAAKGAQRRPEAPLT